MNQKSSEWMQARKKRDTFYHKKIAKNQFLAGSTSD